LFLRPRTKSDEGDGEAHHSWEVLFKGKRRLPIHLWFEGDVEGTITQDLGGGLRELILNVPDHLYSDVYSYLEEWGEVPLPPYILRQRTSDVQIEPFDRMRYQTVYAETWGSAAAPTAGLHFTKASITRLKRKGIQTATTTLHIGLDTFQPIRSESIFEHQMHREWFKVPISTSEEVKQCRKKRGRVVAVGTTVTRALESAAQPDGLLQAVERETDLYITPGYRFKGIDALITNFHQPKSTLLVLVTAFVGEKAVCSNNSINNSGN